MTTPKKPRTPSRVDEIIAHCDGVLRHAIIGAEDEQSATHLITKFTRVQNTRHLQIDVLIKSPGIDELGNESANIRFKYLAKFDAPLASLPEFQADLVGHLLIFVREIQKTMNL